MSEWTPWQVAQCMKRLEDMEAILMLSELKARLEADAQQAGETIYGPNRGTAEILETTEQRRTSHVVRTV